MQMLSCMNLVINNTFTLMYTEVLDCRKKDVMTFIVLVAYKICGYVGQVL